jgi:hypothetical protein
MNINVSISVFSSLGGSPSSVEEKKPYLLPRRSRVAPASDREHPAAPLASPSPTLLLLLAAASGRRRVKPGRRRGLPSPLLGDGGAGRWDRQGRRAGRRARRRGRSAAAWLLRSPGVLGVTAVSWPRSGLERRELGGRLAGGGREHRTQGPACLGSRRRCGRLVRRGSPQARRLGLRLQIWTPCVRAGAGAPGPVKPMFSASDLRAPTARGAVGCRSGCDFRLVFVGGVLRWLASRAGVLRGCAPSLPPVLQCAELGCRDGGPGRWESCGWRASQGLRCWPVATAVWTVWWPASSVL